MPSHARCAVGFCDNDKRYPELAYVRSHVQKLTYHKWPVDPKLAEKWRKQVAKHEVMFSTHRQALVGLLYVQIIFLWGGEPPETLKLTFHRFL